MRTIFASLLGAASLALLSSCVVDAYPPGPPPRVVTSDIGYYSTLPSGYADPTYYYQNRYYYGGVYTPGRYLYGGRYYDGRYYHRGQYYYGGNYRSSYRGGDGGHHDHDHDGHNHGVGRRSYRR